MIRNMPSKSTRKRLGLSSVNKRSPESSLRVDKCLELDHQVRNCQILLYTSQVDHSFLSDLFMGRGLHRHKWTIVTYFEKGRCSYTFEARVGEDGRIEAYRTKGAHPTEPIDALFIGIVRTSPKELLNLAQNHPYNGTSAPIMASFHKCQDWLNQFARMISPELQLP